MKHENYDVSGMSCAACSSRVEKCVRGLEGVSSVSVNLLKNSMTVDYDESRLSSAGIVEAVEKAGYGAKSRSAAKKEERVSPKEKAEKEYRAMKKRLIWSIVFTVPLFYISMGHMMGWPLPSFFLEVENSLTFALTLFLLALPVALINSKYFTHGIRALINRSPDMDSLIALGSGASFAYGIYALYKIGFGLGHGDLTMAMQFSHDLYFEGAGTILTLITLGKYFEARAKGKTTDAVNKLLDLAPKKACVLRPDGTQEVIDAQDVAVGDILIVKTGESIPCDGIITEGSTAVDESAVTGESIPVDKQAGDKVTGATISTSGYFRMRAEKVGQDTALAQIIRLVDEATSSKAPIAKLADKVASVFVPAVISIAVVSLIAWLIAGAGFEFALTIAVSVLVVSCPCALGLATPVAIMVATGKGAGNGVLIKSAESLEKAHEISTVVLDKTGTVTQGHPAVTDIIPAPGVEKEELLYIACSIERLSQHPLASAIAAEGEKEGIRPGELSGFTQLAGQGLSGKLDGADVLAGNLKLMKARGIDVDEAEMEKLSKEGKTPLCFARGGKFCGLIALADVIKDTSREAVSMLQDAGIDVILLTGDNRLTAAAVARQAGISTVIAGVLPEEKEEKVASLQKEGRVVAMVGDGINDAPALARADVGIAIGAGTDVAVDAADIVLMKSDLRDVTFALELSRAAIRNIKENLFWAFFYNVICIPIAAGLFYSAFGLKMNPMVAALAMSFSSVFVVSNALRLRFFRLKRKTVRHKTSSDSVTVITADKEEGEKEMKKEMLVGGMMCANCVRHVKNALEGVEGVSDVNVSLEEGRAVFTVTDAVSDDALTKAVTDEGYEVKGLKAL